MARRLFDRRRMRARRRELDLTQTEVAEALEVGAATVAGWESGDAEPDPERLPGLARVLRADLGRLFPRDGLPDLADLRCDAEYAQRETAVLIGTRSAGPVAYAERGKRRLSARYHAPLAAAYGVSVEALLAAQERSFGHEVADPGPAVPQTLGEKINYLLAATYPGRPAPGDDEIAAAVNAHAGGPITDAQAIADLREGKISDSRPALREGLADFFDVSPHFFASNEAVVRQVVEGLRLLGSVKNGSLDAVAARSLGEDGLPADLIAYISQLAQDFQGHAPDGAAPPPGQTDH